MKIGLYELTADSMNIILERKGKDTHYFSSVANALRHLVNEGVRESHLTDLKAVVSKQDELYKLIESLPTITIASLKTKRGRGRKRLSTSEK